MRLADHIIQSSNPNYAAFAKVVAQAVHFEIDAEVGKIAHAVSKSDVSKLLAIHPFCRMPFKRTWIEWCGHHVEFGKEKTTPRDEHQAARCGVLLVASNDAHSSGFMIAASYHKAAKVDLIINPIASVMDWSGETSVEQIAESAEYIAAMRQFRQFERNTDAELVELSRRGGVSLNPYLPAFWERLKGKPEAEVNQLMNTCADLINGQFGFAEAVLAVMNSRNLVALGEVEDLSRLNKARNRNGKPPLTAFRNVRISLSKSATHKRNRNATGIPTPLHIVRGHFKVRKSGIYWWSPFWRGDAAAGVVSRKGYEVVA